MVGSHAMKEDLEVEVEGEPGTGGEEVPSREPSVLAGVSAGGQVYTNTEIGQLFYGGKRGIIISSSKPRRAERLLNTPRDD